VAVPNFTHHFPTNDGGKPGTAGVDRTNTGAGIGGALGTAGAAIAGATGPVGAAVAAIGSILGALFGGAASTPATPPTPPKPKLQPQVAMPGQTPTPPSYRDAFTPGSSSSSPLAQLDNSPDVRLSAAQSLRDRYRGAY